MEPFTLLGGKLTLTGPRPAEDALWLAASITPPPNARVLDAMAGIGTVGFALLTRCPTLAVTAVEIDPTLTALATSNATLNHHTTYNAHTIDLTAFATATPFDYALMNPPFHATERGHSTPNPTKALAHGLPPNHLTLWLESLHRLLTPTGTMALILHSACQPELLAFAQTHPCTTTLQPLETAPNKPPKRLLAILTKHTIFTLAEHPPLPTHNPTLRKSILEMAKGLSAPSSQDG
jgi:tRNA1(Val) A37 N6-methylase TrmN6